MAPYQIVTTETIPEDNQSTKPVIMTPSDKIAAWNVVGLQGSLLSAFIEPIYLDAVVVSDDFQQGPMQRAFYGRTDEKLLESKQIAAVTANNFKLNRHQVGTYQPNNHKQLLGKTV